MARRNRWAGAAALLVACAGMRAAAADAAGPGEAAGTLLLQDPTVSETEVAFVHAQDLWVVPREGGEARRLTSDAGLEATPRFSPDGKWIAFTGQYEGNTDVYVISAEGGIPRRLTWNPAVDRVQGWHPDGKRILFTSRRVGGPPVERLYAVSTEGGFPESFPLPSVGHADVGRGEGRIAYTPFPDAFRTWKRYRGGRTTPVWIFDPKTADIEVVPHVNASDTFPCWLDGAVWFASDRGGTMNVYRYAPGSSKVEQVTKFEGFDVRNMSAGAGVLAFEQAGAVHLLDPKTREEKRLSITLKTDGLARVPRWQAPAKGDVRGAAVSPFGHRVAFEVRGEIVTVPRENGDPRNLTSSPGCHDRDPVWSPDGKKIAWFSDEGGEYRLAVRDHLGRDAVKSYDLGGARFYHDPVYSPDGKHVLFCDKANRLAFVTLDSGKVTEVVFAQGSLGAFTPTGAWSNDSKWIAYEKKNPATAYDRIELFEVATGKTTRVTDAFGSADSPAFSKDGKLLFFRASVDSGPRRFGLDMTATAARDATVSLYAVVLKKDAKSPLAPKSDEGDQKADAPKRGGGGPGKEGGPDDGKKGEKGDKPEKEKDKDKPEGDEPAEPKKEEKEDGEKSAAGRASGPSIDVEGIDQRIVALPVPAGQLTGLACGKDKLFFLEREPNQPRAPRGEGEREERGAVLKAFDFEDKKAKEVLRGVQSYRVASGGQHLLVNLGGSWQVTSLLGKDEKKLDVDGVRLRVEPEQEWREILREVWRIQRDYFYDPKLHGVDWEAMWTRWSAFLPHVHHRADLNLVIGEMMGELACGHEYVSGGEMPQASPGNAVGLLGCDVEPAGDRYKIARVYRGQNWNPELRAPLTEPGVDVRVGDYLLAVDGKPLAAGEDFDRAFEGKVGDQVELTVSEAAEGGKARKATVVPVASDADLRRRAWIEDNRRRVEELSGGRLAYAYMPDTGNAGMASFDRDFYSQLDRQGLVLDERYNGGGKIADYVIGVLSREVICYWMDREGWLGRTPFGTITGPKVMLVNERAGSGGDAMPWMFKKKRLGPLVGVRTWGGLVGISGYPVLMDGGSVTAAAFGILDTDGKWVVENEGVAPDVEVFETPKDYAAGRDPQLETAVRLALEALERNPPKPPPTVVSPTPR